METAYILADGGGKKVALLFHNFRRCGCNNILSKSHINHKNIVGTAGVEPERKHIKQITKPPL